jgi:hypothetical protein
MHGILFALMFMSASGTSRNPQSAPMEMIHLERGGWMLMLHGQAFLVGTGLQRGARSDAQRMALGESALHIGRRSHFVMRAERVDKDELFPHAIVTRVPTCHTLAVCSPAAPSAGADRVRRFCCRRRSRFRLSMCGVSAEESSSRANARAM